MRRSWLKREARFSDADIRNVPPEFVRRHLASDGLGSHEVRPEIRGRVEFRRHDLLQDAFPARQHLILCRNVVIYFTDEAKDKLYRRFFEALAPGGVPFVGGTERIPNAREIGFQTPKPFFYARPED